MARWQDYEKMVESIYRELEPLATITHDDKLMGKDSKIKRQIDVTIRTKVAGHELLIAVQAKDEKNPIDVNKVGEFASVIRDIGASKGILVCNSGFTRGAINQAKSLGIDLCSAHDAQSRNWKEDISIPVLWIDILPVLQPQLIVYMDVGASIPKNPQEWVLSNDKGKTRLSIFETFVRLWNENKIPKDVGMLHHLEPENENLELLVAKDKWQPISDFRLVYTVNKQAYLKYFTPTEFRGIKNHLTGDIEFSRLRLGITPFKRDDDWTQVADPENVIVDTKGIIVTAEASIISLDGVEHFGFNASLISEH